MNKYEKWYNSLISKGKHRVKPEGYFEKHHIIPQSLGGSNKIDNLVALTAREHYIAHLLLVHMKSGIDKSKMVRALVRFAKKSGRDFELARKILSAESNGSKNPAFGRKWYHHPDTKHKVFCYPNDCPTNYVKGLPHQIGGYKKGKITINNGIFDKMISSQEDIPDGWQRGRLFRHNKETLLKRRKRTEQELQTHANTMKGRKKLRHQETGEIKKVIPSKIEEYLSNGWTASSVPNKTSRKCVIEGIVYHSITEVAQKYKISFPTARSRLNSDEWNDWIWG